MYGARDKETESLQRLLRTETLSQNREGGKPLLARLAMNCSSLCVTEGPHQGDEIPLEQEIIQIGRANWCDLSLPRDRWVSNHHCEVQLQEEGIRLRDCRSRNGILLAGQRIYDACLAPGARFWVGDSEIELRASEDLQDVTIAFSDQSGTLVGGSARMRQIFSMLRRLSQRDVSVLIAGETGTGKSSLARAIHQQSQRCEGPFVTVNCATLAPSLVESALFGHEAGAFTGATRRQRGCFEQAQGGTLLLDEIGELPLELQAKLLDVLERQRLRRLGSEKEVVVDVRILSATNRDLSSAVAQGDFRKDLYYRLAVVELEIPPLRDRPEDIPLLVEHYLLRYCPQRIIQMSARALASLRNYFWPGNVRQLYNTLERALVFLQGDSIDEGDLYLPSLEDSSPYLPDNPPCSAPSTTNSLHPLTPKETGQSNPSSSTSPTNAVTGNMAIAQGDSTLDLQLNPDGVPFDLKALLEEAEASLIEQALLQANGHVPTAAQRLSLSRGWLYNRLKKYDISLP